MASSRPRRPRPVGSPPVPSPEPASLVIVKKSRSRRVNKNVLRRESKLRRPIDGDSGSISRGKDLNLIALSPSNNQVAWKRDDLLRHNGAWVSAEYCMSKLLPWTQYWTCCGSRFYFTSHCPGFEARCEQRDKLHTRLLQESLASQRSIDAVNFRALWEGKACDNTEGFGTLALTMGSNCDRENNNAMKSRPFVRPQWLKRLAASRESASVGLFVAPQTKLQTCNEAVDDTINNNGGRMTTAGVRGMQTTIGLEHVRTIICLMLDACQNIFVVIDSLESLLAVATTSISIKKPTELATTPTTITTRTTVDQCLTPPISNKDTGSSGNNCNVRRESHSEVETGAVLCVQQGVIPAVVLVLNHHAGHLQIESLGLRLLQAFASTTGTQSAIQGNKSVALLCAVRMRPSANLPTATPPTVKTATDATPTFTNDGASGTSTVPAAVASVPGSCPTIGASSLWNNDQAGANCPTFSSDNGSQTVGFEGRSSAIDSWGTGEGIVDKGWVDSNIDNEVAAGAELGGLHGLYPPCAPCASATSLSALEPEPSTSGVSSPMQQQIANIMFVLSVALEWSLPCQVLILNRGGVVAALGTLGRYSGNPRVVESCLKVLEHLSRPPNGRKLALHQRVVETTLGVMKGSR